MKLLLCLLAAFFLSQNAFAYFYELKCDANYQPQVGKNTQQLDMNIVNAGSFGDVKFETVLEEYTYEAVWHKELDTFYFTIKKGNQKLLFSTGRVPTFEHNDSMADVTLPDGTRRWVSCSYMPKN